MDEISSGEISPDGKSGWNQSDEIIRMKRVDEISPGEISPDEKVDEISRAKKSG